MKIYHGIQTAIKSSTLLIYSWMDFKGIWLSEKSQFQKITSFIIIIVSCSQNIKIPEMEDRFVNARG